MTHESQTEALPPDPLDEGPAPTSEPEARRRPGLRAAALIVGAVALAAMALTQTRGAPAVPGPTPTTSTTSTTSPPDTSGLHQVSFTNVWGPVGHLPPTAPQRITVRYDPSGLVRYTFSQLDGSQATSMTTWLAPDTPRVTWTRVPSAPTILVGVFPAEATWLATASASRSPGGGLGSDKHIPGTDVQAVVRVFDTPQQADALQGFIWSPRGGGLSSSDSSPVATTLVSGLPGGESVRLAAVLGWRWFGILSNDWGLLGVSPLGRPVKRVTYPFYPDRLHAATVTTLAGVLPAGATGARASARQHYVTAWRVVPLGDSGRLAYVGQFSGDVTATDLSITWVDATGHRHPLDLGPLPPQPLATPGSDGG